MAKYGRPTKYKGLRSIRLRNPRRVDWNRWDENTDRFRTFKPNLATGPTEDCFDATAVWYEYTLEGFAHRITGEPKPTWKRLLINTQPFIQVFLFYKGRDCFIVEENVHSNRRYISVPSEDRQKIKQAYVSGELRWARFENLRAREIPKRGD